MWSCEDNQEVGLEAATLERVRNSSLVEWLCAENSTGLKHIPKLGLLEARIEKLETRKRLSKWKVSEI